MDKMLMEETDFAKLFQDNWDNIAPVIEEWRKEQQEFTDWFLNGMDQKVFQTKKH